MAIALNGSITLDPTTLPANGRTLSHTVPAGNNRLLIFCVAIEDSTSDRPTAVTFDGVSMSPAVEITGGGGGAAQIWYLLGPNVTTADIVITTAAAISDYCAAALNYTGVKQVAALGETASINASSATQSVNIARQEANSLLASCISYARGVADAFTPAADATERVDQNNGIANALISQFCGENITSTMSSIDLGATVSTSDEYWAVAAEFFEEPEIQSSDVLWAQSLM